ncbi:hypothetical protein KFE25_011130 [Diacronema lutheri]|uniref:Nodulin-like domain-containing protein n=1 Tax=Diacronema lutheri TaxID=2081491 RepID=A0A8J6CD36_DIALT|nr:hypothetical protein KFE25_011130 [Diacronema lutheri]
MEGILAADECRARVLVSALVVETVGGLTFFFPLYSETLRRAYGLSNGSVQLLASLQNVGGAVGLHIGLLYDALGPRTTVLLGLVVGGVGWGGLWAALAYSLPAPFTALAVLAFLQGHGQMIADCASVPTVALHFPAEQYALALGLVKSLIGLSGSLAAQVYAALYAPPAAVGADFVTIDRAIVDFLALAAAWFAGGCAVGALGLRRDGPSADATHSSPAQSAHERARLDTWLAGAYGRMLVLVAVLAAGALVNEHIRAALVATGVLRALHTEQLTLGLGALVMALFLLHVRRGPRAPGLTRLSSAGGGAPEPRVNGSGGGGVKLLLGRADPVIVASLLDVRRAASYDSRFTGSATAAAAAAAARGRRATLSDFDAAAEAEVYLQKLLATEIAIVPPVPTSFSFSRVAPVGSLADLHDEMAELAEYGASLDVSPPTAAVPTAVAAGAGASAGGSGTAMAAPRGAGDSRALIGVGDAPATDAAHARDGAHTRAHPRFVTASVTAPNLLESAAGALPGALPGALRGAQPAVAAQAPNLSLAQALASANFWLQFSVEFALAGSGLVITNNLAQIVRAAGPATGIDAEAMGERPAGMSASSLVCLLGVCNCTGRLAVALAAESLARRGMPRSLPFVPVCLLMACAHLCVAANVRALLAPACALCGFAFGSLAALNPVVVCTLYGSRAFGAIYTSIMLAAALGSLGLSSGLAVSVYARALAPGEPVCVGASCFRTTALTCAALCTAASSLAAVLSAREARATRRRRRDAPRLARAPRISHSPSL